MFSQSPRKPVEINASGDEFLLATPTRVQRATDSLLDWLSAPFSLLRFAKYNRWAALALCTAGCLPVHYLTTIKACVAVAVMTWLLDGLSATRRGLAAQVSLTFTMGVALAMGLTVSSLAGWAEGVTSLLLTALIVSAYAHETAARDDQRFDD